MTEKESKIILIDSNTNFENIDEIEGKKIIITFDYISHEKLLDKKIEHEISDNYLNKAECEEIEDVSYKFSYWFKNPKVENLLKYENINLGTLYYPEFHYFLVPLIKKFYEIRKINYKFSQSKFFGSSILLEIMKLFSNNIELTNSIDQKNSFLYDSYKIPIKIGGKNTSIKISKNNFERLKRIFDKVIYQLFKPKNEDSRKNSILFVECDIIRYREIFADLKKFNINLMLFNRRRQTIWNKNSFSILRKSGCSILTSKLVKNNIQNSIQDGEKYVKQNLKILEKNEFLNIFFLIDKISIWNIIKPVFFELAKKRMLEAVKEIEIAKKILILQKIESIVIWSEHGFNEQIIIHLAKKLNIKLILMQHGIYDDSVEGIKYNKFRGIFPEYSNSFLVWGELMKKYAISVGINEDKIETVGSPIHDLTYENSIETKSDYILFALPPLVKNLVEDLKIETIEKLKVSIKEVIKISKKLNKKLIIKTHPFFGEIDLGDFIRKIEPKIIIVKTGDIIELIKSCSILITFDISTVILDAYILKKPVISILAKKMSFKEARIFKSNSCIIIENLEDIEKNIIGLLNDKEFEKNQIENQTKFVNQYISNIGNSSQKILSYLEKYN